MTNERSVEDIRIAHAEAVDGGRLLSCDVNWDGQPPKAEKADKPCGAYKRRAFRP